MHTTTVADKLLAKAEELEKQAAALRVAAQVMNGQALTSKHTAMASTVIAAAKLRARQHPEGNGNGNGHVSNGDGRTMRGDPAERHTAILAMLADGPKSAVAIHEQLLAHGHQIGRARLVQLLRETPQLRKVGRSAATQWTLGAGKQAPPAADAKTPRESQRDPDVQARRAAKAEQILSILSQHGKPMKISELAAAAREQGIGGLTGIVGLVHKGLLASRGTGDKRTYRLATP